jgi:hypothetical protein
MRPVGSPVRNKIPFPMLRADDIPVFMGFQIFFKPCQYLLPEFKLQVEPTGLAKT